MRIANALVKGDGGFLGDYMRIAIFHDYFGAIGGGERVVIAMAKILDADIITTDTDAVQRIDPDRKSVV